MRRPNGSLEGKAAPGFSLTSVDGKTVSLESLRGKVVLLNFWATWCMPCRAEMPFVELLHRTFREKGLTVLGIDSEDREVAAAYLTKNGYTLPSLLDPDKKAHDDYGARGIPTTVLIDREGKVVFSAAGNMANAELREQLAQLGIW
jgi:thiol-disulfide isomerase/thioredoxin